MKFSRCLAGLRAAITSLLLIALVPSAEAQDTARVSREREALRRAQQALKQSEEQRSGLLREKETLGRDKAAAEATAKQVQAQIGSAQALARNERARVAQLQAALAAQQQAASVAAQTQQAQLQAAQARIDELTRSLAASQAMLAERTRTLAAVNGLLERSTQALTHAEAKNRRLYAISRELIGGVRKRGGGEPVLGLREVEVENWAEQARDRIDPERIRP